MAINEKTELWCEENQYMIYNVVLFHFTKLRSFLSHMRYVN